MGYTFAYEAFKKRFKPYKGVSSNRVMVKKTEADELFQTL